MIRVWWCRRWAARRACIPRGTPGRTLRTRTASANCSAKCAEKSGEERARAICVRDGAGRSGRSASACFPLRRRENSWMRRGTIMASATIRFSSSLHWESRTRKFRARKKICTAIAGKRFTRRLNFFSRSAARQAATDASARVLYSCAGWNERTHEKQKSKTEGLQRPQKKRNRLPARKRETFRGERPHAEALRERIRSACARFCRNWMKRIRT